MPSGSFTICTHAVRLGQPCPRCPRGIATRDTPEPPQPAQSAQPHSRSPQSRRRETDEYARAWDDAEPEPERQEAGECPDCGSVLYWTAGKTAHVCDNCNYWRIPDIAARQAEDTGRLAAERSKKAAALALQNSPEAKAARQAKFDAAKFRAERAAGQWLSLFDSEQFLRGTEEYKIAAEHEPDFYAALKAIQRASDVPELTAAIGVLNSISEPVNGHVGMLRAELMRLAEPEPEDDEEDEPEDEIYEADVVEESDNLPAVRHEPTPDEIVNTMVSGLTQYPDARPVVNCPDIDALNSIVDCATIARRHVPWLRCQPAGMLSLHFWRDKTALMASGKPLTLNSQARALPLPTTNFGAAVYGLTYLYAQSKRKKEPEQQKTAAGELCGFPRCRAVPSRLYGVPARDWQGGLGWHALTGTPQYAACSKSKHQESAEAQLRQAGYQDICHWDLPLSQPVEYRNSFYAPINDNHWAY